MIGQLSLSRLYGRVESIPMLGDQGADEGLDARDVGTRGSCLLPSPKATHMSAAAQLNLRRTSRVDANAVLAVVAVAQFMVILDASIVNVALPTISAMSGSRSRASRGS